MLRRDCQLHCGPQKVHGHGQQYFVTLANILQSSDSKEFHWELVFSQVHNDWHSFCPSTASSHLRWLYRRHYVNSPHSARSRSHQHLSHCNHLYTRFQRTHSESISWIPSSLFPQYSKCGVSISPANPSPQPRAPGI